MTIATQEAACTHHWLIAAANGRYSVGRCRICQAEKEFDNAEPLMAMGMAPKKERGIGGRYH